MKKYSELKAELSQLVDQIEDPDTDIEQVVLLQAKAKKLIDKLKVMLEA
jgi:exonuclease VII small subunit